MCYHEFMFDGEVWYEYLDDPMKELVDLGYYLLDREEMSGDLLNDYSFVVFPVAKAFEGFVKKVMFDLGLIDKEDLMGRMFRIGKSLNPSLPEKFRDDKYIYDRLEEICKAEDIGEDLPLEMWECWKKGRNEIFHYFGGTVTLDLKEAKERLDMMTDLMKKMIDCSVNYRKRK